MRQFRRAIIVIVIGIAAVLQAISIAHAADQKFGPFAVDTATPDVIRLNGIIDAGSALNFRRALQAAPTAKLVTLNSQGGNVQMGLLIADDIHQRKLATYIPKGNSCLSACSFIFLAGIERKVDGELGVHQISSDAPDLVGAQLAISDIIDLLNRFSTPVEVMSVMFKTHPDDMHVFTPEEIERYRLNRSGDPTPSNMAANAAQATAVISTGDASHIQEQPSLPKSKPEAKSLSAALEHDARLTPLQEFTKRPNRIAVYTGLDLFGADISSMRAGDAAACAKSCLLMDGQCKAFTFNANPKIKRGSNCFLKSSSGRADGNSVAFSGQFLSAADADPSTITLGTIDPQTALFDDVDLPGGDLSRRAHRSARTPLDCRLACVDDDLCVAFTYIKPKKECWLKAAIGKPAFGLNMVSGVKKIETFSPATIISLD